MIRRPLVRQAGYLAILLLLVVPFINSVLYLADIHFYPAKESEQRQAYAFFKDRVRKGDEVYVHWGEEALFRYYHLVYGKGSEYQYKVGDAPRNTARDTEHYVALYNREINQYTGKERVWFILNAGNALKPAYKKQTRKLNFSGKTTEAELIKELIMANGKVEAAFSGLGVDVFLVNLGEKR